MSEIDHPNMMVPRQEKDKLGFWFFLGGEVILFSSLILTIVVFRVKYEPQYASFRDHLSRPLAAVNTVILITSSHLAVRAIQAIRSGNQVGLIRNLLGVMFLGAAFIGGQAFEWASMFRSGVSVSSLFGTPFFAVTGIHGTHVLIGLAWASFVIVEALDNAYSKQNYVGVEIFGLYWTFVDIVWIVLFSLIYLI